ncbi:helix-turn-helix domain-containing protein [Promicromonospora sukumoe]|uniref:helix-turn-helix domain-containing protein n=1 Tax=Promicromonospora sukumoe TaxID=88382 RepID=UPI00036AA34C|nr:helix-turn-helix domain-containing protein [Promicromonospora sukumoe]
MREGHLPERARLHDAPVVSVPQRLLDSWQRSEEYGVPLEDVEPVFTGTYDDESLFYRCGQEVLTNLHRTLVDEPVSLMLTDADGLVLNRLSGDSSLLRALDAVHLAPGFSYAEREAGTNGLGLALADRAPTVVRAEQHYALSLCTYTCAAAPVLDPLTGRVEGAVNLTTWSDTSNDLLLALAQSAAGTTAALMLARSRGQHPRPQPRGEVFRIEKPRLEPGAGTLDGLSAPWADALARPSSGVAEGRVVAAVGEPGSGRATLLAQAQRSVRPGDRILAARAPAPQDIDAWLDLWTPELDKPYTAVILRGVESLPLWAAERLRDLVLAARAQGGDDAARRVGFAITAESFEGIPAPLASLVGSVVEVPPLRDRPDDVLPLARQVARRLRGHEITFTRAAERALGNHPWPGNVRGLADAVRFAAARSDVVDVAHLPPGILSGTSRRLSRIEAFERDEIVRVLSRHGTSMQAAADELGMSRATVYRKVAQYGIQVPRG